MFYLLLSRLQNSFSYFNVFNYLTFPHWRGDDDSLHSGARLSGDPFIGWLRTKGSQPIRTDGPESHIVAKAGTPTMGGFIILAGFWRGR
jgi:phospho-N-acetylmuramoyl-pentapeptide-transferase